MRNKYVQMSLFDIYGKVSTAAVQEPPTFFRLMDECIDWEEIIPARFWLAFYQRIGRPRSYNLVSFLKMLVLQRVFGYLEDKQLLNTLKHSKEMRDFCELGKVPDPDKITRFKQDFAPYIEEVLHKLVELTEPICREMDEELADCLIYDSTGIESYVTENNPKFMSKKLQQAKYIAGIDPKFDPYRGVYGLLPDHAGSNPSVKRQYINGHFCYAQKAGILTNGLGIVRHVALFDEDFKKNHPEMAIEKRTDNPDIDKEIGDSTSLKPVFTDFFAAHPTLKYKTFLGDSAFDSYDNYSMLVCGFHFERALIPLNKRNSGKSETDFDENGTPLCPVDKTPMLYQGKCGGKNRSVRFKWVCHKSAPAAKSPVCTCKHPCTNSPYGKCVYTYRDKNLRLYPGIARDSEEWTALYKKRASVERTIQSFKAYGCVSGRKTSDTITTKVDLLLAGIVQLIGVVIADALHELRYAKRIRKLIA